MTLELLVDDYDTMPEMRKSKIIVVVGQTAAGKSALAVWLARKFGGEVVSADSRQVYRGLDIGTGKITRKEMRGIPHYMLDVANLRHPYSIWEFQRTALNHIRYIVAREKLPILVGGTGFYIQSIVDGIVLPEAKPDQSLRERLKNKSSAELFKMLKKLDPRRARNIDPHNPRRLVRAIEIAKALGKVPKAMKAPSNYKVLKIGLRLPPAVLKEKIMKRLRGRLKVGMIAEAKRLHRRGLSWKRMEELGLEYRYLAWFLQGKLSRADMERELIVAIWRYAKRQKTWFKRDKKIKWFGPHQKREMEREVRKFLK